MSKGTSNRLGHIDALKARTDVRCLGWVSRLYSTCVQCVCSIIGSPSRKCNTNLLMKNGLWNPRSRSTRLTRPPGSFARMGSNSSTSASLPAALYPEDSLRCITHSTRGTRNLSASSMASGPDSRMNSSRSFAPGGSDAVTEGPRLRTAPENARLHAHPLHQNPSTNNISRHPTDTFEVLLSQCRTTRGDRFEVARLLHR